MLRYILTTLSLLFSLTYLSGCSLYKPLRLNCPECYGMVQLEHNLYIEPEMTFERRQELVEAYHNSVQSVIASFGGMQSSPLITACSSWECYRKFGGTEPDHGGKAPKGSAYGWKWVRLSPAGLNRTIITHELVHIELHHRIGIWKSYYHLPPWFDEGLAIVISNDKRYSEQEWKKQCRNKSLPDITGFTTREMWNKRFDDLPLYLMSAHEVRNWLSDRGKNRILRLIEKFEDTEDFKSAYLSLHNDRLTRR